MRVKGNAAEAHRLQESVMLNGQQTRNPRRHMQAAALCAMFLCAISAGWPQSKQPAKSPPKTDPPPVVPALPFSAGEKLEFRGGWQFYNSAATLKLSAVEQRVFAGRPAWHFQAQATTLNPLRYIFILDDQFDSYSDSADIASLQYEAYIREQNKHEDRISRLSHDGEPAANGAVVLVPKGTRDPLGALYFLRSVDWTRTPTVNMPVYDGKKLYELRARRTLASDDVEVPAGTFTASRIDLRVYDRGREVVQVRISLWLANISTRTPVLIEAELPFGSVRAELSSVQGP
jgi:uncharacterized protein DUF3108